MGFSNRALVTQIVLTSLSVALLVGAAARALRSPVIGDDDMAALGQSSDVQMSDVAGGKAADGSNIGKSGPSSAFPLSGSPSSTRGLAEVSSGSLRPSRPAVALKPTIAIATNSKLQPRSNVTGTIVKSGASFVLQDADGKIYSLEPFEGVNRFEGRSVEVTGTVDAASSRMHIQSISEHASQTIPG